MIRNYTRPRIKSSRVPDACYDALPVKSHSMDPDFAKLQKQGQELYKQKDYEGALKCFNSVGGLPVGINV